MKELFFYLMLISSIIFGFYISFTWDIPVDNQIGTFLMTCLLLVVLMFSIVNDTYQLIKRKKKENKYH
jgi:hypothetical protein